MRGPLGLYAYLGHICPASVGMTTSTNIMAIQQWLARRRLRMRGLWVTHRCFGSIYSFSQTIHEYLSTQTLTATRRSYHSPSWRSGTAHARARRYQGIMQRERQRPPPPPPQQLKPNKRRGLPAFVGPGRREGRSQAKCSAPGINRSRAFVLCLFLTPCTHPHLDEQVPVICRVF